MCSLLYLSLSLSVCDKRQKQAWHHTQGNIWSLPQLCLQPRIIPVTQPEIAPPWQFIYYSQASCFGLCVWLWHTRRRRCFPPPLNTSVRIPCSIFGLRSDPLTLTGLLLVILFFSRQADPLHRSPLDMSVASFISSQKYPSSWLPSVVGAVGHPYLKHRPPLLTSLTSVNFYILQWSPFLRPSLSNSINHDKVKLSKSCTFTNLFARINVGTSHYITLSIWPQICWKFTFHCVATSLGSIFTLMLWQWSDFRLWSWLEMFWSLGNQQW